MKSANNCEQISGYEPYEFRSGNPMGKGWEGAVICARSFPVKWKNISKQFRQQVMENK
ncbi:hypothetical protein LOAG_13509 [Loa loa]|uniref:Uncharacterized protein n=1 Tax=Loa loa TaxID=7209 RepID=A0A1S0TJD5_LOALO|nr:hypothetical protein LOAG_13509 [Loa loa]EFO15006.2 hypothetical protein LOAG_13509 [Loa loa]